MKRILAVVLSLLAAFACAICPSCADGGDSQSAFTFLSVRMKGNGNGTITAVAQNEFSLLPVVLPVTLTLYRSERPATGADEMTVAQRRDTDDLNLFQSVEIVAEADGGGYFLAVASFVLNGEQLSISSDVIRYDGEGNRIN